MRQSKSLDGDLILLLLLASAKLLFHLFTNGQYGFHRDELATLDDARRLAWGYVAYPPLTPFLGRIELELFGTSLTGFRFLAALAQSMAMVVTGLMARRLGGGRAAMVVAAIAAMLAPISLSASSVFQYVSFDFLWFVLLSYFVIRLIDSNIDSHDGRWWLAIGAAIGLGALTKYAVAFYVAGVVAGVFLTPLRAQLRSKWLWIGAALSIAIALPNFFWQLRHDFITLEFLQFIHARDVRIGRTDSYWIDQLQVSTNVFLFPLAILGLFVVLFTERGRRYRILGWMAVVPLILFALAKGRGYYTGPLYPMLLAAGAADLQRWLDSIRPVPRRIAWGVVSLLLLAGTIVVPLVLPLVPITSRYWPIVNENNGDLREEVGWPELAQEVARIWNTIDPAERKQTGIYCGNYGEAGAINLYGPGHGLPPVISGINSYWQRGPGNPPPKTLIVVGADREDVEEACASVVLAGHITNKAGVRNEETERHPDIFLCREMRQPIEKMWPRLRSFG
ncbi:MAG: glycosyltransferase family 39 protein [Acidobacteriota bacterium]|nr:glycosyltransferase family 39 protein [Acidobacteriota bacterium]